MTTASCTPGQQLEIDKKVRRTPPVPRTRSTLGALRPDSLSSAAWDAEQRGARL